MAGFLEKLLWDETVAGPTPDLGHGGIRKLQSHDSIPTVRSTSDGRPKLQPVPVSRSITLLRTRSLPIGSGSDPSSPTCTIPSTPRTPGTPSEDTKRFTSKKPPTMEAIEDADPRSPTVYDWLLISALDR